MIAHEGSYGYVSQLSREHTISRQSLYTLKSKGQEAMEGVFIPNQQRREQEELIERAILVLLTEAHASREGIKLCLEELLGVHVSTGEISSILAQAGQRAQEWLAQHMPEGMRDMALDEQYGSRRGEAYLNIVDAHTTFVYASVPPVAVDGESWGILFLQMKDQGSRAQVARGRI